MATLGKPAEQANSRKQTTYLEGEVMESPEQHKPPSERTEMGKNGKGHVEAIKPMNPRQYNEEE
jgi:hypothetical protein